MLSALSVRGADMTRAPNLDANDKLVKRGLLVSWCGYRGIVQRVRTGRALVGFKSSQNRLPTPGVVDARGDGDSVKWLACTSVQVVSP